MKNKIFYTKFYNIKILYQGIFSRLLTSSLSRKLESKNPDIIEIFASG